MSMAWDPPKSPGRREPVQVSIVRRGQEQGPGAGDRSRGRSRGRSRVSSRGGGRCMSRNRGRSRRLEEGSRRSNRRDGKSGQERAPRACKRLVVIIGAN